MLFGMSLMKFLAHLSSVAFKYNYFIVAVPSCSLGNSEEAHKKTKCIIKQRKYVLHIENLETSC